MHFRVITNQNLNTTGAQLGLDLVDTFTMLGLKLGQHGGMYIVEMNTLQRKIDKLKAERKLEAEALWGHLGEVEMVNSAEFSVGPDWGLMNNTELINQQLEENPTEVYLIAIKDAQENLWNDLSIAMGMAANGYWSIGCETLVGRIVRLAKIVGPTPWESIQYPLLENKIYQTILEHYGFEVSDDIESNPLYYVPAWRFTCESIKTLDPEDYL